MHKTILLSALLTLMPAAYAGDHSPIDEASKEALYAEKIALKEQEIAQKEALKQQELLSKHGGAGSGYTLYNPPQITNFQPNDVVVFAGDSLTYLGFQGGWASIWQQYISTYYPTINVHFVNDGVGGNTSSDLLARFGSVTMYNPNVVVIWIGLNDVRHGNANYSLLQSNLQNMIAQCKACPSVRTIILVSPFCDGERYEGRNALDSTLDATTVFENQIAVANGVNFINMRALWQSAEYVYNRGDYAAGILTSDGIHPNALGAQIVEGAFIKSFGE